MTSLEMQTAFEIEANIIDKRLKPLSSDVFYWINRAIEKFIRTRYTGNNPKGESFEQTQKRIDDLRTLIKEVTISTIAGSYKPNSWIALFPNDYMYTVVEEVQVIYNSIITRTGITEINIDRYNSELDNPFSEFNMHYGKAKPLRLFYGNYAELITDGSYIVPYLYLRYISIPQVVNLTFSCNLPSPTHPEIVKMAEGLYIENTKDPRYQTIENEITHQE
jgi:hypothetical protein